MIRRVVLRTAREEARDVLREMILSGEIPPETHLEEVKLSGQIGVSRTPVREALVALQQEGLVTSRPHRGFVVVRANQAFVRDSYPVMGALEALAMQLAGPALEANVAALRALNRRLAEAKSKARQYELDRAFHALLTQDCGNARLLRLLETERARIQLVDGSHRRGMANLDGSLAEHDSLIAAIEGGRITEAAEILTTHWRGGVEVVSRWLEEAE